MNRYTCLVILILCLIFPGKHAFGQLTASDSIMLQSALNQAVSLYQRENVEISHLLNGSEYIEYEGYIAGNQFFETEYLEDGSVFYDGVLYQNVPLLYDVVKDDVVVIRPKALFNIRLNPEKIKYFNFLDHTFIRQEGDGIKNLTFPTGFYDLLYDGGTKVLAKRQKILYETIKENKIYREFRKTDKYYIRKDGNNHPVGSKRSVLNVFKDQKSALLKFLRANKINFRNNPELTMIKIAQQYDELVK